MFVIRLFPETYNRSSQFPGNCYEKVKSETKLIQDAVMKELKLDPIDKEVVIMYENDSKDSNILNGKRIVEVPKTRPSWFSKNLLAKDSEFPRKKNEAVSETAFAVEVEPTKKSS
ncbi:39S ribosomal protein L32 like protein [Argiope bruennichi]|uniref:39S ribosomal protein L32 like protein n=1 Tax=Argiope bruennichi TaxID=94029 RepID=A0A8T0ENW1_ARGBR|nr:39S ribosomal protein L32 like protein [Argiope bruennichi]